MEKCNQRETEQSQTVAIVGLGLMGASLAMAARQQLPGVQVLGWARRAEAISEARQSHIIDDGATDPEKVLPQADITFLCLPLTPTIEFAHSYASLWQEGALVTDVGSVKEPIVQNLHPVFAEHNVRFIGSHPMAGSEQTGMAHAQADLYNNAVVFITPYNEKQDTEKTEQLTRFWEKLGANVFSIPPDTHDRAVAGTSHAVHLLAAIAVEAFLDDSLASRAAGGGFRDFSRIASSSPDMWTEISRYNKDYVVESLDRFTEELHKLRNCLAADKWEELRNYLADAENRRDSWLAGTIKQKGNPN